METRIRAANPADAGSIARVHVESWRTTYDGIVDAEFLAGLSYSDRESSWTRILTSDQPDTHTSVAEISASDIVGFAHAGPEREGNETYRGELYAIYLLEEHQGRGLGRRLVSAVAQGLLDCGFSSMRLWVLEDNHSARHFYELLGGQPVARKTITIGGRALVEVSYAWQDISDLAVET